MKLAASIAAMLAGLIMDSSGYVDSVAQTESSLSAIRLLMSLIPAAFCFIGIGIQHLYPIDEAMHKKIREEIENQKRDLVED